VASNLKERESSHCAVSNHSQVKAVRNHLLLSDRTDNIAISQHRSNFGLPAGYLASHTDSFKFINNSYCARVKIHRDCENRGLEAEPPISVERSSDGPTSISFLPRVPFSGGLKLARTSHVADRIAVYNIGVDPG
jgi:hypothetical protein